MFRRKPNRDDIDHLIARKKYSKAIRWSRQLLAEEPKDFQLRRKLAELLLLVDQRQEGLSILRDLAQELSTAGFVAKAIVVLKRIQILTLEGPHTEAKIAKLIDSQSLRTRRLDDGTQEPTTPGDPTLSSTTDRQGDPERRDGDDADTISLVPLSFSESPLFRRFNRSEMLAVISSLRAFSFQPGEIVVSEGQPGESLYLIVSGSVRVYVLSQLRKNVQVRVLSAGDFFGEISIHTGKARTATVTAIETTELLALDRKALKHLGRNHPEIPLIIHDFCQRREKSPEELAARGWPDDEASWPV
jgi:hypothetical protein